MKSFAAFLRRAVYMVGITVGLLTEMPVWWIVTSFMKDLSRCGGAMTPFHVAVFKLLGVKVTTSYPEGFDNRRNAVILANHQSWLDIPLITGWVRPVGFLAKKELYSLPLLGIPMRRVGCIVVDRKNREANRNIAPKMAEMLAKGYSYGVFPEGTRTPDGTLQKFRTGIFKILAGHPLEVWPVTIDGAQAVMPKNRRGLFPGEIRITVHPAISAEEVRGMSWDALMERVRSDIASALPASAVSAPEKTAE